jgi:UDP-MurNAc hydroxylase
MVYDFPPEEQHRLGVQKRADQMERALHYLRDVHAPHVFPIAGPPCFLDDELYAFNDLDGDPANIFPDQTVFLRELEQAGITGGELLVPGTVATLADGTCTVEQPSGAMAPDAIFGDKRTAIDRYRDDWRPWLEAERASWPREPIDVVGALREWWEPILDVAPLTRAGVGGAVLLHLGDVGVLVDFPSGTVREWSGEPVVYRIDTDRALVQSCIERHVEDWVNELFLSCRFRAHRDGPYNEYIYTFFKCLSLERMAYCEGHYATRSERSDEMFRCGDYLVQKRCPHLRADLERFGTVEDGILECKVHHWRFELATGRCLTSDDDEHRLRTVRVDDPGAR